MSAPKIPEQMLAAQVIEFKQPYKIHQIPTPQPSTLGPNDLLVKVAVASLCHTDGMVSDGIMGTKLPCTASHEGSGTVVAVGSAVSSSSASDPDSNDQHASTHDMSASSSGIPKFKVGDRVMNGLFRNQCGICADCQGPENYKQYCPNSAGAIGVHIDGNFAEYVVIDAANAAKLPDKVSFETAAPLACAGSTVWRGVLQAELKKGEWLCLVGSGGGLGHLGIQFAKALGLNVVGIDARDEGIALSKETGADVVIDARAGKDKVVEQVQKITNGAGADATVCLSDAKSAAGLACAVTKMHGTMVQIAQPETVDIPFAELIFRDVRVKGSLICSPEEGRRMLDVVAKHNISVKTNPFNGLNEIPKLVALAHGGKMAGKGIVIVDPEQVKNERKDAV